MFFAYSKTLVIFLLLKSCHFKLLIKAFETHFFEGPRHRKKAAKTTNSGVSTSSCNNSAIKKTVLSNTVVKTNAYSPNSSVSYSPHMTDKKLPIKPKQAFDYDTENDSSKQPLETRRTI